jgi:hypothetical protein
MSTISVEIPKDVLNLIERHKEIDWQRIAQQSLLDYARKVALAEQLTQGSTLTEEDVEELDQRIKEGLAKHFS